MQVAKLSIHWSSSLLAKFDWNSMKELLAFLTEVPETKFQENNLAEKSVFIDKVRNMFERVERSGNMVKETKEMVQPGSIMEHLHSDYLIIRNEYLQERKQLRKQLELINLLFRELSR